MYMEVSMRQLTFGVPYRYEDFLEDTEYLLATYPSMIHVYKLGESYDGRDILVFQIGDGPIPIIITAGVHARETINPMALMRMIENYLGLIENEEPVIVDFGISSRLQTENLSTRGIISQLFFEMHECTIAHAIHGGTPFEQPVTRSTEPGNLPTAEEVKEELRFQTAEKGDSTPTEYNISNIFHTFTFYIVPLLNPDGYEIALGGFDTIRDPELRNQAMKMGIPYEEWKANARGVDINRNFPSVTWRPKFPGDRPGSENETKALMHLFDLIPAAGYLDLHSRGKTIYYYKGNMPKEYNERQKYIADRLREVTGYELMPPESEIEAMDSGGNTVHYFSEQFHQPAITIETVPDLEPFPLDVRHQRPAFEEIYLAPLEFAIAILEYEQEHKSSRNGRMEQME